MDALALPIHNYLLLMKRSALLVSERDKANMILLVTMLGQLDKDIISYNYGLFDKELEPLETIAKRYDVQPEVITEIIEKDLHKLAITPEWQMMMQGFSPTVKQKIGINKV
ncbi:MAG: RNA polymerase subunit sigma [Prevotella sp.]|nr:RNA polymerase subunit sigma [Prevotella sp.]MDT3386644.1 RNA polymerase subunit sigma [Bacteroidota bacterium]